VRGTLLHLEVERLPRPTKTPEPLWFWWTGPHPPDLAAVWQAYVARCAIEHTFRFFKQTRKWTTPKLRDPQAADRWTWRLLLAYVQLRLPLLTGGARDLEERQQTMQRTIAWSYELLAPAEQSLFRRLAVFAGGWTLEAAEAVCAAPEGAEPLRLNVLEGLGTLVDQSLVWQREEGGEPRFGMMHVIREFAMEHLEASGETEALRRAHAAYYVALAEQAWAADMAASDGGIAHYDRLEREQDNLRATLAWLRARAEAARQTGSTGRATVRRARTRREVEAPAVQGLRLAGALLWPWAFHGHLSEGRAWLEAFLALAAPAGGAAGVPSDHGERGEGPSPPARRSGRMRAARAASEAVVRARALYAAGVLAYWQGESVQAVPLLEQSLALYQALGDRLAAYFVLNNLGVALQDLGDRERARACYEECLALGRALGGRGFIGMPLGNLSRLTLAAGDLEQAAVLSEEAHTIARQGHTDTVAADSRTVQALIAWRRGQLSQAAAWAHEALALHHAARDVRRDGDGLEVCAIMCATQGHAERAARLLGAAAAAREQIGMRRPMIVPTAADIESAVAPARAALGEAAWAAAFAAGQALSLEEAIAEALDTPPE
jgi:tetratricopeptide (TPR) repeat protein